MAARVDTAYVKLWGELVGAVSWSEQHACSVFEYAPGFLKKGLDISPLMMSLDAARRGDRIFSFPNLNYDSFLGLPGLLADSLPDKFGHKIIDAWLAQKGLDISSFSPIARLCYMGVRGMGALEFSPAINDKLNQSVPIEISELVALTQEVMRQRNSLDVNLGNDHQEKEEALINILRVGASAGGARAKAVIAMNQHGHIISGQANAPEGYDYWLLKFDGVTDLELGTPRGYGRIEYAYYLMAKAAGITMSECRLLEENNRAHFMTKRFDRVQGKKIHMQSLCGIAHYDFNFPGATSYEQAFFVMRQLKLTKAEIEQQFCRLVFNVMAKNLDDHTKNISYLMDADGTWQLSPAYDVTYAHNPAGKWTNSHQMSINGKRSQLTRNDLLAVAESVDINAAETIIDEVSAAIANWPQFAKEAGVPKAIQDEIWRHHEHIN